jgi:hypothetical protein
MVKAKIKTFMSKNYSKLIPFVEDGNGSFFTVMRQGVQGLC